MIAGDPADNIPGIKGIGHKTAFQLLEKYGSLEEVLRNVPTMKEGKVKRMLSEAREEEWELLRQLVSLHTIEKLLKEGVPDRFIAKIDYNLLLQELTSLGFDAIVGFHRLNDVVDTADDHENKGTDTPIGKAANEDVNINDTVGPTENGPHPESLEAPFKATLDEEQENKELATLVREIMKRCLGKTIKLGSVYKGSQVTKIKAGATERNGSCVVDVELQTADGNEHSIINDMHNDVDAHTGSENKQLASLIGKIMRRYLGAPIRLGDNFNGSKVIKIKAGATNSFGTTLIDVEIVTADNKQYSLIRDIAQVA